MAIIEDQVFCMRHCWCGVPGTKCPQCEKLIADEETRWRALSTEEKIEELRQTIQALARRSANALYIK